MNRRNTLKLMGGAIAALALPVAAAITPSKATYPFTWPDMEPDDRFYARWAGGPDYAFAVGITPHVCVHVDLDEDFRKLKMIAGHFEKQRQTLCGQPGDLERYASLSAKRLGHINEFRQRADGDWDIVPEQPTKHTVSPSIDLANEMPAWRLEIVYPSFFDPSTGWPENLDRTETVADFPK